MKRNNEIKKYIEESGDAEQMEGMKGGEDRVERKEKEENRKEI